MEDLNLSTFRDVDFSKPNDLFTLSIVGRFLSSKIMYTNTAWNIEVWRKRIENSGLRCRQTECHRLVTVFRLLKKKKLRLNWRNIDENYTATLFMACGIMGIKNAFELSSVTLRVLCPLEPIHHWFANSYCPLKTADKSLIKVLNLRK